jgi:hypothetical protein
MARHLDERRAHLNEEKGSGIDMITAALDVRLSRIRGGMNPLDICLRRRP